MLCNNGKILEHNNEDTFKPQISNLLTQSAVYAITSESQITNADAKAFVCSPASRVLMTDVFLQTILGFSRLRFQTFANSAIASVALVTNASPLLAQCVHIANGSIQDAILGIWIAIEMSIAEISRKALALCFLALCQ